MGAYFLYSSALIKRYISETGTEWVRNLTDFRTGNSIYAARIAAVELTAALARAQRADAVAATDAAVAMNQVRHAFAHEFRVIEMTASLLSHAVNHARNHALRAYDAVQLAAATEANRRRTQAGLEPLTFVCSDNGLNASARAEGLKVEDPNNHP